MGLCLRVTLLAHRFCYCGRRCGARPVWDDVMWAMVCLGVAHRFSSSCTLFSSAGLLPCRRHRQPPPRIVLLRNFSLPPLRTLLALALADMMP